jgi:histidinol-phosphate aminotransferase
MMMKLNVPASIRSIKPYVPGKPLKELEREYGIADSIKLASNENPLGPSPMAMEAILKSISGLNRYPDGSCHDLVEKLSGKYQVGRENIVIGNGSDDIIGMLTTVFLSPGDEAILPTPSFLMYEISVKTQGAVPLLVPLKNLSIDLDEMKQRISSRTRMIFICNPNNPTGTIVPMEDLKAFVQEIPPEVVVVVDEAYIEFARDENCRSAVELLNSGSPVATLRTFSKAYGLAGLRVGYGIMAGEMVQFLNRVRQPFNVNSLAQIGAAAALEDQAFFEKTIQLVHDGLSFLYGELNRLGVIYYPTQANFFLIDVKTDADSVFKRLLELGVIVRSMSSYGYPEYIRVNVGLPAENKRLIHALATVLELRP